MEFTEKEKEQWKEGCKMHKEAKRARIREENERIAKKIVEDSLIPMFAKLHQRYTMDTTLTVYVIASMERYVLLTIPLDVEMNEYPAEANEDNKCDIWEFVLEEARRHGVDDASNRTSFFDGCVVYEFIMYLK